MGYICNKCGWASMLGTVQIDNHEKECVGKIYREEMYDIHAVDHVLEAKNSEIDDLKQRVSKLLGVIDGIYESGIRLEGNESSVREALGLEVDEPEVFD